MGAHRCGEHAGAVGFAGGAAVGELRRGRAVACASSIFVSLTSGSDSHAGPTRL